MTTMIEIRALVSTYKGESVHLVGLLDVPTNVVMITKTAEFSTTPKSTKDTVIVTDTPSLMSCWQLAYNEEQHLSEVISVYQERYKLGLIVFDDAMNRFKPGQVIQPGQVDERGIKWRFDSNITNNHMASMLLIWASSRAARGHNVAYEAKEQVSDDDSALPFWI